MKTAVLTIRVTQATRERLERLARKEGRSLSQQAERLIDAGLGGGSAGARPRIRSLSGALASARVPDLADFKRVRAALSASLRARTKP